MQNAQTDLEVLGTDTGPLLLGSRRAAALWLAKRKREGVCLARCRPHRSTRCCHAHAWPSTRTAQQDRPCIWAGHLQGQSAAASHRLLRTSAALGLGLGSGGFL